MSAAFKEAPIKGYENLVQTLMAAYEEIGFKRGRSIIAKLLQYLVNDLKLVIKKDKIFFYDMTPMEAELFSDNDNE